MSEIEIDKFYEKIKDAAAAYEIYFSKLEISGFSGVEPILSSTIQDSLAKIKNAENKLPKIEKSVKNIFQAFHKINDFYFSLENVYTIFHDNQIDIIQKGARTSSGMTFSESYLLDLAKSFQQITSISIVIQEEYGKKFLTEYFGSLISVGNLEELAELRRTYEKYLSDMTGRTVIDLYVTVLQNAINTGEKEIIKQAMKDVEELKTSILSAGNKDAEESRPKDANLIQRLIQRFNLIPDGVGRPLPNIIEELSSGAATLNDVSKILSASGAKKFGFIVMKKLIGQPITHNLWTLIDENYLRAKGMDDFSRTAEGINSHKLERSRTIIPVNLDTSAPMTTKDMLKFIDSSKESDISSRYYYILETLDNKNYHFLIPWADTSIKYIPALWFESLQDENQVPSRRMRSYNSLLNGAILEYLHEPLSEISFSTREDDHYWRNLRNILTRSIMHYIGGILDTSPLRAFGKILADEDLYSRLTTLIIEQISLDNLNTASVDAVIIKTIGVEIFASYFKEIDKFKKGFRKEITDNYKKNYETSHKGREFSKKEVLELFEKLVTETLEKFINRKSNIYLTIDGKISLLNKTLLLKNSGNHEY